MQFTQFKPARLAVTSTALAFAALVAGCGGGTAPLPAMVIKGTAATGAAFSGAAISVTCSSSSSATTSNADGSFNMVVGAGRGPCVLIATRGATVLRSITPGAGVANITPLTDLLTDYLATRAGTTPSNLLTNANGNAILSNIQALTDGQTSIANLLKTNYGVTLTTTNFLTATLTTPQGGAQSAADKDLDALKAKGTLLDANGKPLATVVTALQDLATGSPFVAPTGATN